MNYKYITEDNLENKQTYMYSSYGGVEFLKAYFSSRQNLSDRNEMEEIQEKLNNEDGDIGTEVRRELDYIWQQIQVGKEQKILFRLNEYVKSFEVRKRIYTKYLITWKPEENARYNDYESYLILAECLIGAYKYTDCLKYLSCLLKLDDTLLSIRSRLTKGQQEHLNSIVKQETSFVQLLCEKNGIQVREN